MVDYETYSEDYVICPYCGELIRPDEEFFFDPDFDEYECSRCYKAFKVKTESRTVWSWETARKESDES